MSKESTSIRYDEVPLFLRGSAFYLQLAADDEQSGMLTIPQACFKADDTVKDLDDFKQLLYTIIFWGLDAIPDSVLDFCHHHDPAVWQETAEDLPENGCLHDILTSCYDGTESILPAVQSGHPEVVQHWMKIHPPHNLTVPTHACSDVASIGDLHLLRELHEHDYPWSKQACAESVRGGHLKCLVYLHEQGCPWDESACTAAAFRGHLQCLQYLHENSCPWDASHICSFAASAGHLSCLQFAHEHGAILNEDVTLTTHTDCLRYALEHNCPVHSIVSSGTNLNELQVEHVELLQEHGVIWSEDVCVASLKCPVTHTQYLIQHGFPYDESITHHAIWSGTAEHLAYLIDENLLEMSEKLYSEAIMNSSLECVQVLVDRGCPCNFTWHMQPFGHESYNDERILSCIQYATEHGWACSIDLVKFVFVNKQLPLCRAYLRIEGIVTRTSLQQLLRDHGTWGVKRESSI